MSASGIRELTCIFVIDAVPDGKEHIIIFFSRESRIQRAEYLFRTPILLKSL